MRKKGFTLVELMVVIIIMGILATLAIPNYNNSLERALGQEAKANLKLIAAAERIYRMETNTYYPSFGNETNIANINSNLKLSLTEAKWDYSVTGGASTFTVFAARWGSGGYLDCGYVLAYNEPGGEPVPDAPCP